MKLNYRKYNLPKKKLTKLRKYFDSRKITSGNLNFLKEKLYRRLCLIEPHYTTVKKLINLP